MEMLEYLYEEQVPYYDMTVEEIHDNCREFMKEYGPLWAKGEFVPIYAQNIKGIALHHDE